MYTKVFRQIYDGTLADNWQALVTFQQLLILADADGVVDMTIGAIQRTTGIPLEILEKGIAVLEAPDHGSRTPDMEGRRIARLDHHRAWGWRLVNFRKYRQLSSREDKKEADRLRIAEQRGAEKAKEIAGVASRSATSQPVADVAHTDTYTEAEAKELASLRSASSSADADDLLAGADPNRKPATALTQLGDKRAERLAQVAREAVETFNASPLVKSNGGLLANVSPSVGREKRASQVKRCIRTARAIAAESYSSTTIPRQFWVDYWQECHNDEHKSGREGGGRGHENWLPTFEYLTREDTMLKVYDRANAEDAA